MPPEGTGSSSMELEGAMGVDHRDHNSINAFNRTCGARNTYFTPAVCGCPADIPRDASRQFQRARRRWVSSHPLMWQWAASFFILKIRVFAWSKTMAHSGSGCVQRSDTPYFTNYAR